MAITALDIKDKQFTTKFRGYNEQEVDEFLDNWYHMFSTDF